MILAIDICTQLAYNRNKGFEESLQHLNPILGTLLANTQPDDLNTLSMRFTLYFDIRLHNFTLTFSMHNT